MGVRRSFVRRAWRGRSFSPETGPARAPFGKRRSSPVPFPGVEDRRPPGVLFVVGTPIGNLGDLSPRALETLRGVRHLACEDTRTARRLAARFEFSARLVSYHEHNEEARAAALLEKLRAGEDVALVADAGTPLLSDPGYRLVRAARLAGVPVRAVPGASAVTAALSVSGLPTDCFTFLGFPPPRRGAARRRFLDRAAAAPGSLVLFESARRAPALLRDLAERLGASREASLSREMTKVFEENRFGTLADLAERAAEHPLRGEVTLVVGPAPRRAAKGAERRTEKLAEEQAKGADSA